MAYADEKKKVGRAPFQYVEIDLDYCSQTYGISPCLAAGASATDTFTALPGVVDSFSDLDGTQLSSHTSDSGHSWTITTRGGQPWYTPEIQSNRLVIPDNSTSTSYFIGSETTSSSQSAKISVAPDSSSFADTAYVEARIWCDLGQTDFYAIRIDFNAEQVILLKTVLDSITTLDTYSFSLIADSEYVIEVLAADSSITGTLNGVEILSATDSSVTKTGHVGFYSRLNSDSGKALYLDDFSAELSGTPISNHNEIGAYTVLNIGTYDQPVIIGNRAFCTEPSIPVIASTSDDHDTQAEITITGSSVGTYAELSARYDNVSGYRYAILFYPNAGNVTLYKYTPSGISIGSALFSFTSGVTYTCRITVSGSSIKVYIDQNEIISVTDTAIPTGKFSGFMGARVGADTVYFDNFKARLGATTATTPCFNTRATCQYPLAYSAETKTYRFYENVADAPYLDLTGYPALKVGGIRTEPTRITPGKGLGYRASVKFSLEDFTHHDRGVDPYVDSRTYDPTTQGTFFGKFIARNKYYAGRTARIYSGFLGDGYSVDNFQVREYIVETIDGPNNKGMVTVDCKDILKDLDNAVAPTASEVYLTASITDSATTIPIDTTGESALPITDSDGVNYRLEPIAGEIDFYTSSGAQSNIALTGAFELPFFDSTGAAADIPLVSTDFTVGETVRIRIGSELIDGTVASGQLESATRGAGGSTAAAHNIGASVQICITFAGVVVTDALRTILAYAGIGESQINTAQWDEQESKWLGLTDMTGTISEPTKVKEIVEALMEQGTVYIWWDERDQLINLKAIAPQEEISTLTAYTDDYNFLHNSINVKRDLKKQVTQVWARYSKIDQTGDDDARNMSDLYIGYDQDAESAAQWGRVRSEEVNCQFVTNAGHAAAIAFRKLGRLRDGSTEVPFELDAKDSDLWTGDEFKMESLALQGADGSAEAIRMQVLEVRELADGKYKYLAEKSAFQGQRYAYITEDGWPTYENASEDERINAAFISSVTGYMSDGTRGYLII